MKKLNKTSEPLILKANAESWLAEILSYSSVEDCPKYSLERYKHKEIKTALIAETKGKCVYCESKVEHIYPGDIEHIKPKVRFRELTFTWDNLTLACWKCNHNKLDYFDFVLGLINPYVEDPEEYIFAQGPVLFSKQNKDRGRITIEKLDLNRIGLFERRLERLDQINMLIKLLQNEINAEKKVMLKQAILEELNEDKEYLLTVKNYLINNGII